jgi:ankyrin repeat protein
LTDIRVAIATGNLEQDESMLDEEALPEEEILVDVCAGLVTIDKEAHTIRLVHYTAQEYFLRTRDTLFPSAQKEISRTCLRYLCLDGLHRGFKRYRFRYPSIYWGCHPARGSEQELKDEITAFLNKSENLLVSIELLRLEPIPFVSLFEPRKVKALDVAIWLSTFFGLEYTAKVLILKGADVNTDMGHPGYQLIWTAIFSGHENLFHLLLEHSAEVHEPDAAYSWTLLGTAAKKGLLSVARTLLSRGVDVNAQDEENGSALIGSVLGADENTLGGWEEFCSLLVDKGVNLEARKEPHGTALSFALVRKFSSIARLLLNVGADVEARNDSHQTLLAAAICCNDYEAAELLLDAGALTTDLDLRGFSALHYAASDERLTMLLISRRVDVGRRSRAGETALHRSAALGCEEVVFLLLSNGTDINATSQEGNTPLKQALMHRHFDLEKRMRLWMANNGAVMNTGIGNEPSPDRQKAIVLSEQACVTGGNSEVWVVSFSNDGTLLASIGDRGFLEIYSVDGMNLLHSWDHKSAGRQLLWSPDDTLLIAGCFELDSEVYIWNTEVSDSGQVRTSIIRLCISDMAVYPSICEIGRANLLRHMGSRQASILDDFLL